MLLLAGLLIDTKRYQYCSIFSRLKLVRTYVAMVFRVIAEIETQKIVKYDFVIRNL